MDVSTFKLAHNEARARIQKIIEYLDDIEANAEILSDDLASLSGTLKVHLVSEDRTLYPALMRSDNKEARDLAGWFKENMGHLSRSWAEYIERWRTHLHILEDPAQFREETLGIFAELIQRMNTEEAQLYVLAEKYG